MSATAEEPAAAEAPAAEAAAAETAAATDGTAAPAAASNLLIHKKGWYVGINGGINNVDNAELTETGGANNDPEDGLLGLLFPSQLSGLGLVGDVLGAVVDGVCGPLGLLLCSSDPFLDFLLGPVGGPDAGVDRNYSTTFKKGTVLSGNVGYSYGNGFRPEVSFGFRSNDVESLSFGSGTGLLEGRSSQRVSGQIESTSVLGNIWYDFNTDSRIVPYVGIGLGAAQVGFKDFTATTEDDDGDIVTVPLVDDSATVFAYQAGAGVGYQLTDSLMASLDLRYLSSSDASLKTAAGGKIDVKYESTSAMLGLRYQFGSKPSKCPDTPAGVAVDADGCPLDSDGDGVADYLDKCPGTPAGAKVDADGCEIDSDGDGVPDSRDQCPGTPAGVSVDDKGCPIDSDGDGVPDYLDKCPNTPAGTLVDAEGCPAEDADGDGVADYLDKCPGTPKGIPVGKDGCPLDSDGDGIPDYLDECPNSPAGAKVLPNGCAPVGDCRRPRPGEEVDENGCALEKKFILRGVKFEFDSDVLTAEAKVILDGVAVTLANYGDISVELAGHTDNIGTDAYNLGLSERRSNSVKNYLTGKGVSAERMTPVGYGLTQPIASNDSEEGREENRRVELKVLE